MRILVIGATGMLGQHAARAAHLRGHDLVLGYHQPANESHLTDLKHPRTQLNLDDPNSLRAALKDVDAVIHAAAPYPRTPRHFSVEVAAGQAQMGQFYDICAEMPKLRKIVYVGAAAALRRNPLGLGDESIDYNSSPPTRNPYMQLKWALDYQALEQARKGLPVVVGIPSMTFGEYDYAPTTGRLLVGLARGTMSRYVRGKRNVIAGVDAGRGLLRVCEDGRPGERYLLTGANTDLEAIARYVSNWANRSMPRQLSLRMAKNISKLQVLRYRLFGGALPTLDSTAIAVMTSGQYLNGAKAENELGFKAQLSLDETLERALFWFKMQGIL